MDNLVLGQCPHCFAINRHEPNCNRDTDANVLRRIAQNDYMIDGKYLRDGRALLDIADRLDARLQSTTKGAE
jgi:hypothetical protein